MNLSAAPTQLEWFEFHGVPLNNGNAEYPGGDNIGVLSRWKPLSPLHGVSWEQVSEVFDMIQAGTDGGKEFYTPAVQANRWVGNLLMKHLHLNAEQAKTVVKEWIDAGVLVAKKYNSPAADYKATKKLCVEPDGLAKLRHRMASRA